MYTQRSKAAFHICFLVTTLLTSANISAQQKTWCNPLNIDYGYSPIPALTQWGKHRATADPVIVLYKNTYYLFATNQVGYWWSDDMLNWHFISHSFLKPYNKVYDDLCAPAVVVTGDTMLVLGSTHNHDFPIWMSTDPKLDTWKEVTDSLPIDAWDPDLFLDNDNRLYLYWGSSNIDPLRGVELDRKTFQPTGKSADLLRLDDQRYGWQRFGEYYDNVFLPPFIEGSWMTKHDGKYYLQYGAPGTEFSGYADGVAVSNNPLGPFTEQMHNPFSFKPGGFIRGAGHGATYQDVYSNWWHISTMVINVKNNFERRIGIFPAGFDKDGMLYSNNNFGDYPHYLPTRKEDHLQGGFTGWMLLNYGKPVMASSTLGGHTPNLAVDESVKTYWSATTADKGEWLQTDLGAVSTVNAIQINYADQDVTFMSKQTGTYHQYILYASKDGKKWQVIMDKSNNHTDVPHDYIEFASPIAARYIKLENIHMPTGKFAISGLRVFGKGVGTIPDTVAGFTVLRTAADKRSAWLRWKPVDNAYGYNVYFGIAPDKLYNSIMLYSDNQYYLSVMDKELPYYFAIEAINENGVSKRTQVMKAE